MFLSLDPDPLSEVWIRIRILLSVSKNSKKNLDSYCFVTSFGLFLSLKNNLYVPSKGNKQKTFFLNLFFVGILKVSDENLLVRGMDPRIRIHTKMSWIRNPGENCWRFTEIQDFGIFSKLSKRLSG